MPNPTVPTPSRRLRSYAVAAALVAVTLPLAACGGGLSADSSCRDFLEASPADQDAAVRSIAVDEGAQNAVTPLGRPNIDYLCAGNPDTTLGEAVRMTG